ncbi:MAG: hypothetical protein MZU95_15600 [Desulfomicrobium escambiense]|nr:hypothetical protein [Desulfomicrobium escambiense]
MKRRALREARRVRGVCRALAVRTRLVDHGNRERGIITGGTARLVRARRPATECTGDQPGRPEARRSCTPCRGTPSPAFLQSHDEVKVLEELDDILETRDQGPGLRRGPRRRDHRQAGHRGAGWASTRRTKVRDILAATWPDLFAGPRPAAAAGARRPCRRGRPRCARAAATARPSTPSRRPWPPDDITVADIGCHTLGFLPPYRMGAGPAVHGRTPPATASGLALFNRDAPGGVLPRRLDLLPRRHARASSTPCSTGHDLTLVIMENGTTAMTGHQDHPGTGRNFNGAGRGHPVRRVARGPGRAANIRRGRHLQPGEADRHGPGSRGRAGLQGDHRPASLHAQADPRGSGAGPAPPGRSAGRGGPGDLRDASTSASSASPARPSRPRADGAVQVSRDLCIGDGSCRQTCPAEALAAQDKEDRR